MDSQVKEAVREGAEVLLEGEQTGNRGYFYKPTVLGNVNPKMSVAQEEVFGPVAPIIGANDEMEAIEFADFILYCSCYLAQKINSIKKRDPRPNFMQRPNFFP